MKRILYLIAIVSLCSCGKEKISSNAKRMDFSLLEQYDWQNIAYHEEPGQLSDTIISYSDTSRYSFNGSNFTFRNQYTTIKVVFGSGQPVYTLNQTNSTLDGQYEVTTVDSTLTVTYETLVGSSPAWDVPGEVKTVRSTWKILKLNHQELKLQSLPSDNSPFPGTYTEQVYTAVTK